MNPPVTPIRLEPILLGMLRERMPGVTFGSLMPDTPPKGDSCTIVAIPQGMQTAITQWVRVTLLVRSLRADGTGDLQRAADTWTQAAGVILDAAATRPLTGASLESGPQRLAIDDAQDIAMYGAILCTVDITRQ